MRDHLDTPQVSASSTLTFSMAWTTFTLVGLHPQYASGWLGVILSARHSCLHQLNLPRIQFIECV